MIDDRSPPLHLVFVGGICRIEPDLDIDTRLPIPEDYGDCLVRAAASSSTQWWQVATAFAQSLLEQAQHDDAWVCVTGPPALRVQQGGRVAKPRLASVLPGQVAKLDASDFRRTPIATWTYTRSCSKITFVQSPCSITAWARCPPTAVIVSGHDDFGPRGTRLIALMSLWPTATLILLDCPTIISETDTLRAWNREGRQPLSRTWSLTSQQRVERERLAGANAKFGSRRPVVIDAEFGITRATIDDEEYPPERVAAATSFLHSRYDLSIDIWDIVRDPGLATLVAKEETEHVVVPGERLDRVPKEFMERADHLQDVRTAVEAELMNFPLGNWHPASEANLSWKLADPELPIEWTLRLGRNSLTVFASATGGRWLPLEVRAQGGWHHGLGWNIGIRREGHPHLRAFLEAYLSKMRPVVRDKMGTADGKSGP